MLDTNGDQQVSQQEFLAAAKDCMEAEKAMSNGGTAEICSLLQQTSAFLASNQVSFYGACCPCSLGLYMLLQRCLQRCQHHGASRLLSGCCAGQVMHVTVNESDPSLNGRQAACAHACMAVARLGGWRVPCSVIAEMKLCAAGASHGRISECG